QARRHEGDARYFAPAGLSLRLADDAGSGDAPRRGGAQALYRRGLQGGVRPRPADLRRLRLLHGIPDAAPLPRFAPRRDRRRHLGDPAQHHRPRARAHDPVTEAAMHPLAGVRILELGQIIAGTYGGQVLSDLGAEVIKVEGPDGDIGRNPSVAPYRGSSGLFLTLNRNKQSIVVDLKKEAGRQVFYDLVKVADVVIDNFRPGVLERLAVDYPTLARINPRIIQCSVTGFGSTGAYRDSPA